MRTRSSTLGGLVALALLASAPTAAQDAPVEGDAPAPVLEATGRTEATGHVDRRGFTFRLRSGAALVLPPNLPVGARNMRFGESRDRVANTDVAAGFTRVGNALSFDAAVNATSAPLVVSLPVGRTRLGERQHFVLAVEQPTLCREGSRPLPGNPPNFCSSWELVNARVVEGRIVAEVPTPGGYRLIFGTMPCAEGGAPAPGCEPPSPLAEEAGSVF